MGYFRSRALSAAARLGVADALGDQERTLDQLASACGADRAALYRLLRALASFGVVAETSPASFVLTPLGQPLRKDAPDSAWAGVVFWGDLLADSWSYLTECVRAGTACSASAAARRSLALVAGSGGPRGFSRCHGHLARGRLHADRARLGLFKISSRCRSGRRRWCVDCGDPASLSQCTRYAGRSPGRHCASVASF